MEIFLFSSQDVVFVDMEVLMNSSKLSAAQAGAIESTRKPQKKDQMDVGTWREARET